MAHRKIGQLSLADHLVSQAGRSSDFLRRLDSLIDWRPLSEIVDVLHSSPDGAPSYPPVVLLKMLLLGQWHGLGDPAIEDAVTDRTSFRRFCGLSLHDAVPDHTSIHRFRNALGEAGLDGKVFEAVNAQLSARGLVLRKGTLIDASLVASAARPPARPAEPAPPGPDGEAPSKLQRSAVDPDARWTKKAGRYHFGYKVHVAVDQGSGIVRRVLLTDASVNDTVPADSLICGDETAVFADAAYRTHARVAALEAKAIAAHLMRRANKHHPLSEADKALNRWIGRQRGPVEQPFGHMKTAYRWARARFIGLGRNTTHALLLFTAMNLKRMAVLCT